MEGAGDELLARAAGALDEDGGVRGRDLADEAVDLLHGGGFPRELLQLPRQAAFELGDFLLQRGRLHALGDADVERLEVGDGLLNEVVRAVLHGLDGEVDVSVGRQEDDGEVGADRLGLFEERDAVLARHLDVGDEKFDVLVRVEGLERLFRARRRQAFVGGREPTRERVAQGLLVVNDEDLLFHLSWRTLFSSRGRRMVMVVPSPGADSTAMVPPWSAMIRLETISPNPVPFSFVVR